MGERGSDELHLLPTFVADERGGPRPNPEAARLDARARVAGGDGRGVPAASAHPAASRSSSRLADEGMLPGDRVRLQPGRLRPGGRAVPRRRAAASPTPASGADPRASPRPTPPGSPTTTSTVLGYGAWLAGLEAGFAAHHAGMVPPMKEAVEEAFAAGLVKVVFATETLSLGINMPARSVVIEKLSKFTGERHEFLTPGEYTQLTGRAGRRGIDERRVRGRVLEPVRALRPGRRAGVAADRTRSRSSFRPTYNMAANLVRALPARRRRTTC